MTLPGLDAWITGGRYHEETLERRCKKCSFIFDIPGAVDFGSFEAFDEKFWICPECNHDTAEDD